MPVSKHGRMPLPRVRAALALSGLVLTAGAAGALAAPGGAAPRPGSPALATPFRLTQDRAVDDRLATAEDRYAPAGGCYVVEAPGQGFVSEVDGTVGVTKDRAAASPLHFQATRLGEYLLATNEGRDTSYEGATWDVRGYLAAGGPLGSDPLTTAVLGAGSVVQADAPGEDAEWRLVAAGKDPEAKGQPFLLSVPSRGSSLRVADGALSLVDDAAQATPVVLRHVVDDVPGDDDPNGTACASWPEIDTDSEGRPAPAKGGPAAKAQGFFEAHVHGMAFEFLGGELRCGRPWHEYGVEYALGSCAEERNPLNALLEVGLAGQDPAFVGEYDPVGWPTFASWPQQDTLTHEQYYWRWLERAYLGGLRLTTNLLVDNKALCRAYPVKKNSCNEMDGVRLQAQRLFELQDYVDAQYGGPGEGWFRIVTSPTEARRAIAAGRMAVVLGIEVSALFDCDELLDQPQCTEEDIDLRLQEVFDMGVRQMELVNKFDNALSGVTGDGGSTGVIVNAGNKQVTGHWWDMRSCPEDVPHTHGDTSTGDQHDKTQLSATDGAPEGTDALAGRVLDAFGGATRGVVAPLYGSGPHCNSRGLTPLGEHLIRSMVAKGMMFDPDHMSASAQRAALDLVEGEIAPAERAAAAEQGRPARRPSVISSHSWGNEAIYQRIYHADGVVAPRTDDAKGFVDRWQVLRGYAAAQAPKGYDFGLGYGADTNGLGGQPGPRTDARRKVDYSKPFAAPIGGVLLHQQSSGLRTFDINVEGVSQYGMFADWFHEVRLAADEKAPGLGDQITRDMLNGAEQYLAMWERSVVGGGACVADGSAPDVDDLMALLGGNSEGFLDAVGAPASRDGAAYTYCATEDGAPAVVDVVFDEDGVAVEVKPSTSGLEPVVGGHDHSTHSHDLVGSVAETVGAGVPVGGDLALGGMLVLGLTGLGAGTLTGRYRV